MSLSDCRNAKGLLVHRASHPMARFSQCIIGMILFVGGTRERSANCVLLLPRSPHWALLRKMETNTFWEGAMESFGFATLEPAKSCGKSKAPENLSRLRRTEEL